MSRSRDGTWLTTRSPILSTPCVISSRPATMRNAVVLPQPDGPTRTMNSPSWISRSSPRTALVPSGYVFPTWSNVTAAKLPPPPALCSGKSLSQLCSLSKRRQRRIRRVDAFQRRCGHAGRPAAEPAAPRGERGDHDDGRDRDSDRPVLEADRRVARLRLPLAGCDLVRCGVRHGDQVDAVGIAIRVV